MLPLFTPLFILTAVFALGSTCTTFAETTEAPITQPQSEEWSDPAFKDLWMQKVIALKDEKLNHLLQSTFQKKGAAGLKDRAFQKKINTIVARTYRMDLNRIGLDRIENTPDDLEKQFPFFLMASGATSLAFSGEEANLPSSTTVGGGNGPGNGVPDSANVTVMGGYIISAKDQVAGLYLHTFRFDQAEQESSDSSFVPPDNIFGIDYTHRFHENLSLQLTGTYLDSSGIQDPTAGLVYSRTFGLSEDADLTWNLGSSLSAPISEKSVNSTKITTLANYALARYKSSDWRTQLKLNYAYTFYRDTEDLTDDGKASGAFGDSGGTETDGGFVLPSLPSFDVNYSSREVARSIANFTSKFSIFPHLDLGLGAKITYSYLNSTASKWTSNFTVLSVGVKYEGFSLEGAATLTTLKIDQDHFTLPTEWGAKITASYTLALFGIPRPELLAAMKEDLPKTSKKKDKD